MNFLRIPKISPSNLNHFNCLICDGSPPGGGGDPPQRQLGAEIRTEILEEFLKESPCKGISLRILLRKSPSKGYSM